MPSESSLLRARAWGRAGLALAIGWAGVAGCTRARHGDDRESVGGNPSEGVPIESADSTPADDGAPASSEAGLPQSSADTIIRTGVWHAVDAVGAVRDLAYDAQTSSIVAATARGLMVSRDDGATWTVLAGNERCSTIVADGHGRAYALCGGHLLVGGIADGAPAWSEWALPRGVAAEVLAVSPLRPSRLYVGAAAISADAGGALGGALFWTETMGTSWSVVERIVDATVPPRDGIDELTAHGVQALALHPGSPDVLVARLARGIYMSDDGGRTLREAGAAGSARGSWPAVAAAGFASLHAGDIAFDARGRTAYVKSDGSLVVSVDGGAGWDEQPGALRAFAAHPRRSGVAYLLSGSGALQLSVDFGRTYEAVRLDGAVPAAVGAAARILVSPRSGRVLAGGGAGLALLVPGT
jgi:hypothetical protein